jgi:hypothetical protein
MNSQLQAELISLALVVVVIVRFLFRELRARTVRLSTMWFRPAILLALTALLVWTTVRVTPFAVGELGVALGIGAAAGIVVGVLVSGSTAIEATGKPGLVRLHGSWVTVAIWIVALVLRVAVRFAVGGSPLNPSPAVNSGTIMLVAAAFSTFAVLIVARVRSMGIA